MSPTTRRLGRLFGLLVAAAIVASACGAASAPALTDPRAIVTAALTTTQAAKSVHLEATLDGKINADLSGSGAAGAPIALTGTTASADVDIAAGNAHATFTVPALLGLTGELIQIGDTSYVKTSLSGDKFQSQKSGESLPVGPTDTKTMVDNIGEFLTKPGVDPVKGDDVACGSVQCYTVNIELTPAELNALGGAEAGAVASQLPIDLSSASLNLTVRVEKDSNRLAGLAVTVAMGDQGSLSLDLAFSKWDQPVTVTAPPADQVQAAS